ncbi:phospholipase D/nuclease [Basidiobolus meristosporus CBS 931.73]|uniref:Phospholipase D/nuclease n=1 Tax=Basidiobolus meristosporus CBS 931.73 TaxID=1314790 RepID=A0A1Y1Z208_9FUNG|nr:phospholipase D/nuclease [Basidiobolus meristosporus CBS 931.73]|eukprot:ORY04331.1 phospholipase D/nuclease [Basidiobolus meristosporus CBS 931.73]
MSKLPANNREIPILFVHGMSGANSGVLMEQVRRYSNLKTHLPQLPPYGTHHSKVMILFYEEHVRIVIHTANLVPQDWRNKTQAAYVSPLLQKKTDIGRSTVFERDFLSYLAAYGNILNSTRDKLSKYDFSPCKGTIIGSVPGRHAGTELHKWGHMRVREILSTMALGKQFQSSSLILQFSSIGSLGKTPDWLTKELGESFSRYQPDDQPNQSKRRKMEERSIRADQFTPPDIKLIFPTVEEVRNSFEGYAAGGSIPYDLKNFLNQQHYLQKHMCHWKANDQGLNRAMPHIKTYARVTDSGEELAWCMVTSSNLSKAAW